MRNFRESFCCSDKVHLGGEIKIAKKIVDVKKIVNQVHKKGKKIGFVPTMGYLHKGHLSLVRIARRSSDFVIVSIFVNPMQFGPNEDFARYPRDLKMDITLLKREKVDLLFLPTIKEMYPEGYRTYVEVMGLSEVLCGRFRPEHFKGVTTVVLKLFNIVKPNVAVFGNKDFQQGVIIEKMVKDLNLDVRIIRAPIIREDDGLAMSSRNTYLSQVERENATVLYTALKWARNAYYKENMRSPQFVIHQMQKMIEEKGGRIDYIAIVDTKNLEPAQFLNKGNLVALAVFFGNTRLIDNIII